MAKFISQLIRFVQFFSLSLSSRYCFSSGVLHLDAYSGEIERFISGLIITKLEAKREQKCTKFIMKNKIQRQNIIHNLLMITCSRTSSVH